MPYLDYVKDSEPNLDYVPDSEPNLLDCAQDSDSGLFFQESEPDPSRLPSDSALVQTMASCHSLIKMQGELTGYPMDIKLFEAIEWVSALLFSQSSL